MLEDNTDPGFEILYEQGPCLVVLKPAGVLTQAPPAIDSMESRIKAFLKIRDNKPGRVYLGVPHRLDRPVSGVMVFAKHARAARRLSEQFAGRLVTKTYWAFLSGQIEPESGTWTDYVRKIPDKAQAEIVDSEHPQGRHAVLHYQVLAKNDLGTWLEINLETGRTHQIRLQAASRGYPLLGDHQYGSTTAFGHQHEDQRLRSIALHARHLKFRHPMTHETVSITAELPTSWTSLGLSSRQE